MSNIKTNSDISEPIERNYEIVVIGGGLAGICAAIAAARLGTKVALIHDRPVLGGASSSESRVLVAGVESERGMPGVPFWFHYSRETGIVEELTLENRFRNSAQVLNIWDLLLWEKVTTEPNITLFLNTSAMKAVMANDTTINAIRAWQTTTFKEFLIAGTLFIDASGDGHIAYDAGAEYRMGRESEAEFGESLAPAKADTYTMAPSVFIEWIDVGRPISYTPPPWAITLSDADLLPRKISIPGAYPEHRFHDASRLRTGGEGGNRGWWWVEYGGMRDTIKDSEEIRDELWALAFGMWNKIKNYSDTADTFDISWVAPVPGKRESRRFIGDHILTQNDIWGRTLFPDRVAYGGRAIDLHTPGNIYARFAPAEYVPTKGLYNIPYRCLYSKNIQNLMLAGRNISISHVALGSVRVQRQTAIIGQATGTAAHLCIKYGINPRGIYEQHVDELQQLLLKYDSTILDLKNNDPTDVARNAKITASSTQPLEIVPSNDVELNVSELNTFRGQMFWVTEQRIAAVELYLESRLEDDVELQLYLRRADSIYDFSATENLAAAKALVPGTGEPQPVNQQPPIAPIKRSWVSFKFDREVEPGYYWVWLSKLEDMYWCGVNREPIATRRVMMDGEEWRPIKNRGSYCFKLTPRSTPHIGKNVISCVTHPTDEGTNIWISERGLPQHVELEFNSPRDIDTIYLTFDSNLDKQWGPSWSFLRGAAPELVRDYVIYCEINDKWEPVVREERNYQRHRRHTFDSITSQKIRLEILTTNGAPEARVYEIRAYKEQV